jgi:hypothetical protein
MVWRSLSKGGFCESCGWPNLTFDSVRYTERLLCNAFVGRGITPIKLSNNGWISFYFIWYCIKVIWITMKSRRKYLYFSRGLGLPGERGCYPGRYQRGLADSGRQTNPDWCSHPEQDVHYLLSYHQSSGRKHAAPGFSDWKGKWLVFVSFQFIRISWIGEISISCVLRSG